MSGAGTGRTRKAHVIVERTRTGGFFVERTIKCRCGWKHTHYSAGHLNDLFKQHRAEADAISGVAASSDVTSSLDRAIGPDSDVSTEETV